MPPEKRREARDAAPKDEPATSADLIDADDARERRRRPPVFDAARAVSPNAVYLRPVAPLDPAPPPQAARPHPGTLEDERATDRVAKPFVRGLPEDPAAGKLTAGGAGARMLRIAVIVVLAAVALWLVLG